MNSMKKGIVSIFIANVINMMMSILTNFVLPKYLSVDSYAAIKTFQLYVGCVGVFAFGYIDGMFLKYGGAELNKINVNDLNVNLSTFRIYQILVMIITIVIASFTKDFVFIMFAITITPLNLTGYYKMLYQAIGEFGKYSRLMNITTVATFLFNMMLIFLFKTDSYQSYLMGYVVIYIIISIILDVLFAKQFNYELRVLKFSVREAITNIKEGILLMLGNFANILLTSMDRWFIKILMATVDFAQYSFACSMETMVNVAVTPITVTLYNYFCRENDNQKYISIRNMMSIVATLFVSCAFWGKFILEVFLTKYLGAVDVMFYLFAAQIFYIIIKSVYVNLYKAKKLQRQYFLKLIIVIVSGAIFNVVCYTIFHNKEAFAIGTLLSAILWFIFCVYDFRWITCDKNLVLYLFISMFTFIFIGITLESIFGFCLYVVIELIISYVLLKKDFCDLIRLVIETVTEKFKLNKKM